jgi:hypothetical protein
VASRHESYAPSEVRRVLASGGTFVTQQVGGRDLEELNHALGGLPHTYREWNLAAATDELEQAGFEVLDGREELLPGSYRIQSSEDVAGALELFRMNYERRNETLWCRGSHRVE